MIAHTASYDELIESLKAGRDEWGFTSRKGRPYKRIKLSQWNTLQIVTIGTIQSYGVDHVRAHCCPAVANLLGNEPSDPDIIKHGMTMFAQSLYQFCVDELLQGDEYKHIPEKRKEWIRHVALEGEQCNDAEISGTAEEIENRVEDHLAENFDRVSSAVKATVYINLLGEIPEEVEVKREDYIRKVPAE